MTSLSWSLHDERLEICGALDRNDVPQLWSEIKVPVSTSQLICSLLGVTHIDSAGLAMLLQLQLHLKKQNCQLKIVDSPDELRTLCQLSNVDHILNIN